MAARVLSEAEVRGVLEPCWQEVVDQYIEKKMISTGRLPRLVFDSSYHDSCRHYAATERDGSIVYFAPELVHRPPEVILAIMAHEMGHVVDLTQPGRFFYRDGGLIVLQDLPTKNLRKHFAKWNDRSRDEEEHVADAIAEVAMGQKIGYIGPKTCLVECLGKGKPRPKGLR